jgi:ATP-dependent Zn protease
MCEEREHIAYHEGGHALMAVLVNREIKTVSLTNRHTILDPVRLEGITTGTGTLSDDDYEYCERELKVILAGHRGEIVGLGHTSNDLRNYLDDIEKGNVIHRVLRERGGRKGTGNGLTAEVEHDLEQKRAALERLAKALLSEGDLTSERVKALVTGV